MSPQHLRVKSLLPNSTPKLTLATVHGFQLHLPPALLFLQRAGLLQMLFCSLEVLQGEGRDLEEGAINGGNKM